MPVLTQKPRLCTMNNWTCTKQEENSKFIYHLLQPWGESGSAWWPWGFPAGWRPPVSAPDSRSASRTPRTRTPRRCWSERTDLWTESNSCTSSDRTDHRTKTTRHENLWKHRQFLFLREQNSWRQFTLEWLLTRDSFSCVSRWRKSLCFQHCLSQPFFYIPTPVTLRNDRDLSPQARQMPFFLYPPVKACFPQTYHASLTCVYRIGRTCARAHNTYTHVCTRLGVRVEP